MVDPGKGALQYVNAGHNPPFLLRADGSVERLETGGFLLGVFPEATYETAGLTMGAGDLLILYSDGVTEAMDAQGAEFGDDRLVAFLSKHRDVPVEELVDALIAQVREYAGKPGDDVTVTAIRHG
jgi:sigma-B regulation protein RsbU (phosphoserine phosphatase)